MFSPYASFEDPSRAAYFEDRFRDIVHTGAGRVDVILAPQDGVGTGKVSPSDKDSVASPENVTTLYAAAQNASASETWANIELFVRDSSTCRAGSITFTSDCSAHKARIDQQIELAEPYAQKITGLRLVHVHEQGSRVGGLSGDSRVLPAQDRCPE